MDLSCCSFSFYEHFYRQFIYAVFLYSNQKDVFKSENILYVITNHYIQSEITNILFIDF